MRCREQGDLHFRRAGVSRFAPELVNDLRLAVLGDRHLDPCNLRLVLLLPIVTVYFLTSLLQESYQGGKGY